MIDYIRVLINPAHYAWCGDRANLMAEEIASTERAALAKAFPDARIEVRLGDRLAEDLNPYFFHSSLAGTAEGDREHLAALDTAMELLDPIYAAIEERWTREIEGAR